MKNDKLEIMMEMQKKFQEKVGFNFDEMNEKEISAYSSGVNLL